MGSRATKRLVCPRIVSRTQTSDPLGWEVRARNLHNNRHSFHSFSRKKAIRHVYVICDPTKGLSLCLSFCINSRFSFCTAFRLNYTDSNKKQSRFFTPRPTSHHNADHFMIQLGVYFCPPPFLPKKHLHNEGEKLHNDFSS